MRQFSSALGSFAVGAAFLAASASAQASSIETIVIKGKHFFTSSGHEQFYIRGVAYQQDYNSNGTAASNADYTDPLANGAICNRDIPYLKKLNTNVIRTYAVDPTKNHDDCMNALAAAGIYVISDLSAPSTSINRNTPTWDVELFERYTALIDNLSKYNNVIGFFAGNEVSNSENTTAASAFVKAAVRDSKYYISQTVQRPLYVGYATSDDATIRDQVAQYMNCDSDIANNVDFYGYNIYSWCGDSTYQESGYQERTQFFQDYSVPVFFAEYGCNDVEPRPFSEVGALYSEPMTSVWSGGIVYMYFQEENNYGLVTVSGNSVTPRQDFDNLSSQIAKIDPTSTNYNAVPTTASPTTCPSVDATWLATASPLPNRPNADLCNCVEPALGCVVNPKTDDTEYGDLFGFICGQNSGNYCRGIAANATTGTYGTYEMCNPDIQLSWVMNQYFLAQDSSPSACAFSGAAVTQAAAKPTGTCLSLVQAAGAQGTGSAPSNLASSSSSPTGNAAAGSSLAGSGSGYFYVALYFAVAVASGAAMIAL